MNELDLQKTLFDAFKTLNTFSGIAFITENNVSYSNNTTFTIPSDKRWFRVTFLNGEPFQSGIFENAPNEYSGILQIDICTPLDKGESEAENKFRWISSLFKRGKCFNKVEIKRTAYIANKSAQDDHYCTTIRIEWQATLEV